jgi:phosphoglycerol transferase MdoB-like AlkP superfamily enzyme
MLLPSKIFNTKINKILVYLMVSMIIFVTLFSSVSEYFFWDEFGKRFNFIAVDYLVYTHEVIKNIQESYPLNIILSSIFVVSLIISYKSKFNLQDNVSFKSRIIFLLLYIIVSIIEFNIIDKQPFTNISHNVYANELSKNGIYSFFSAFRHNELDYYEFYKTIDKKEAFANLKQLEGFDNLSSKEVKATTKYQKKNIILIMVESLSAEYLGTYGNKQNITPHLDKLIKKSLFFNNLFATGTRTVRGMEAVNLSIPPTPGRSIIKRPKNNTLDSIGKILFNEGYENKFIYAGYGYFDNMNDFYSKNYYQIVDRIKFTKDEITFANAWGACDEDLFNKVLKEADKSYKKNKKFFSFVMTTSNHRPYTYPDGKIDIPSHTGRSGAVKYTDFAINEFIKKAQKKKWFKDTIFIIVADHNGSSAGKSDLPLHRYKIPCIVYAPDFIKPQVVSKLSSQVDIMPTIFSLIGIGYKAKFYGNNILDKNFNQRAFVGNYQKLGYVKDNFLYYLTPDKKVHKKFIKELKRTSSLYEDRAISNKEMQRIVTYYQTAYDLYKESK